MSGTFKWNGRTLPLFDHPYNTTVLNERAVEMSIARNWLEWQEGDGLEVGNVTSHYVGPLGQRVVDLNEKAAGVENLDVFAIDGGYDWILSISTLEHVGWDRDRTDPAWVIDPDAAALALYHLHGLLNAGGRMLVTVPMGYHPPFDEALFGLSDDPFVDACTFVRSGAGWRQTKKLTSKPYGATTKWAEAVWVGEFTA